MLVVMGLCASVPAQEPRWFGTQAMPKAIVRAKADGDVARGMMVQSVSGLAAKAVNEGRADEMVWVSTGNADLERWYAMWMKSAGRIEMRGELEPWDLVERFAKRGIVKGYILYRLDQSRGEINQHRTGMDLSVNVASSLAGILDAIIVDESLEEQAKAHGLKLLLDARGKTQAWCFQTYKDRFNRRLLCTQDPRKLHVRDLAIAQGALTIYGSENVVADALKWLEPPAAILGWNGGDEFVTTRASTVQGHFQTASDWCMNLPVLMAGSEAAKQAKVKRFDPRQIDWNDRRSGVSFIASDGDNVQFFEGGFFSDKSYWGNKQRGAIPFGWSCCFAHLSQLAPAAVEYAASSATANDSFIEWGGGYYYPDLFAAERPDRWELLARHAQRTWDLMQENGTSVIGFNVWKPESEDARKAYEVFAGQCEGLLGILVFQYAPYEGGAGKVFWVKDRRGVEIPVITARYSIWEHSNARPRSGTPAKVAREIRETVAKAQASDLPRYDWGTAHVWSYFREAPGDDENAENLPQADAWKNGGMRGCAPVMWCAKRLPKEIRVISPEEMIWRVRMKHNAELTKREIQRLEH